MRIARATMLAALTAAVSGCATLNRDECVNADWETIGLEDGARGHPAERIGDHRRACAKHGVSPDLPAYESGRARGLRSYCTPNKAYQSGLNGTTGLQGLCPPDLEPAFLAAHASGFRVHQAAAEASQAKRALESAEQTLARLEEDIEGHRAVIVAEDSSGAARAESLDRIEQLRQERRLLLEQTLPELEDRALQKAQTYQQILEAEPAPL